MDKHTLIALNWPQFRHDLRAYQLHQGMTQTQLAMNLDISLAALSRYYHGSRTPPSEIFVSALLLMRKRPEDYVIERR